MTLPNFNLTYGFTVSDLFLEKNITTFHDAIDVIHSLPYGRVEKPQHIGNVIKFGKGTCSTKHAAIKALADEHQVQDLYLKLVIFKMSEANTNGIQHILSRYDLPYMLEAHTYIQYHDYIYDYTFPGGNDLLWGESVLQDITINADQIGDFKMKFHQNVLQDWIDSDQLPYTLDKLWNIREQCILALHQETI